MKITITEGLDDWYTVTADIQKKPLQSTTTLTFNHVSVEDMNFQDAANDAAIKFSQRYSNIYIGLSGGADSEFVAEVFLRNKIPFTPIVSSVPDSPEHMFALEWCKKNSINPIFIEFKYDDIRLVKKSFLASRAIKQKCNITTVVMYLSEYVQELGGVLLTGESPLFRHTNGYYDAAGDILDIHSNVFYPKLWKPSLPIHGFLMYTPELFLAMTREGDTSLNHSSAKCKLYNVPFRVKDFNPPPVITNSLEYDIHTKLSIRDYCPLPALEWTKDELIGLLTR